MSVDQLTRRIYKLQRVIAQLQSSHSHLKSRLDEKADVSFLKKQLQLSALNFQRQLQFLRPPLAFNHTEIGFSSKLGIESSLAPLKSKVMQNLFDIRDLQSKFIGLQQTLPQIITKIDRIQKDIKQADDINSPPRLQFRYWQQQLSSECNSPKNDRKLSLERELQMRVLPEAELKVTQIPAVRLRNFQTNLQKKEELSFDEDIFSEMKVQQQSKGLQSISLVKSQLQDQIHREFAQLRSSFQSVVEQQRKKIQLQTEQITLKARQQEQSFQRKQDQLRQLIAKQQLIQHSLLQHQQKNILEKQSAKDQLAQSLLKKNILIQSSQACTNHYLKSKRRSAKRSLPPVRDCSSYQSKSKRQTKERKNGSKTGTEQVYQVDEEGYLMDADGVYLLDQEENFVKLSQSQLWQLQDN